MNQETVMLPLQQLQGNRWNRKSFDSQAIQELSDSIKIKNVLEPLIVRKLEEGKYEIASGERRWKASMLAGLTEVPCLVQALTDEDVQDLNLICNIQREDIPALDKAAMVKARMGSTMTQDQVARKLGKSREWVAELLRYLDLPKEVHDHIAGLPLGTSHLQAIASLQTPEYQEQLAQEIKDGTVPLEAVQRRAHHLNTGFKSSQAKRAKKNGGAAREAADGEPKVVVQQHDGSPTTTSGMTVKASQPIGSMSSNGFFGHGPQR